MSVRTIERRIDRLERDGRTTLADISDQVLDRICYLDAKEFATDNVTPDEETELIALRAHPKVQAALSG